MLMIDEKIDIINMYFATHRTCNLNCKYCYIPDYNRLQRNVDDNDILKSLKLFISKVENENYGIGSFCFHGSEPSLMSGETLGKAILMVNEHWESNNINGFDVAIQSNGKRFTQEYLNSVLEVIKNPRLLKLGFSIDPPMQVHNEIRDNSYEIVFNNYQTAKELGFRVSVLSVVSKITMSHLTDFSTWIKTQLNESKSNNNPYRVKIKFATGDLALSNEEIIEFSDFLIEENLLSLPQMLTPGYCIHDGNNCLWFEFDIEGNCYSCNKVYNNDGIFANWQTEEFKKIFEKREKLYNLEFTNSDCSDCEFDFLCNSGCPIDRIQVGEMKGKAHECLMIKRVYNHLLNNTQEHIIEFYNKNI